MTVLNIEEVNMQFRFDMMPHEDGNNLYYKVIVWDMAGKPICDYLTRLTHPENEEFFGENPVYKPFPPNPYAPVWVHKDENILKINRAIIKLRDGAS